MPLQVITGNHAAGHALSVAGEANRTARGTVCGIYPITPQTEIIESLGRWIDDGELAARMVTLESEHSMVTAAGAAAATGVRVFTATSSQGLLYAMEMLYTVAGWRAPFVLVNVSRGLSAPVTLEPDHEDVLAARDSGFLQIHCATCQEVLDSVLLAYRLAEDPEKQRAVLEQAAASGGTDVLAYAAEAALANLDLEAGDGDAATTRLQKLMTSHEGFLAEQAALDLALMYEHLERTDDARAIYDASRSRRN